MTITPYKGRHIGNCAEVFAYRNLHRAVWSLKATSGLHKGRVIAHADDVTLFGCKLMVSLAGRERVLRERRKNVHAGVIGIVSQFDGNELADSDKRRLSYNPYKSWRFEVDGYPVNMATHVHLDSEGKAWSIGAVA